MWALIVAVFVTTKGLFIYESDELIFKDRAACIEYMHSEEGTGDLDDLLKTVTEEYGEGNFTMSAECVEEKQ